MIIPIVSIPPSIANGLKHDKDLFPRCETFQHIQEYCTGMVVLDKPSIKRISQCLVDGPCQSSLNKSITASPWSEESVNQKRLESIQQYHNNGFTVGIIDTTLFHHPRGQSIYGVYKYWDYINNNYTYAIQLVTSAISTNDRLDGFDYKIYHRSFVKQEKLYLEDTALTAEKQDISTCQNRLIELLNFQLHKQQAKTKDQLAVELIDEMESSNLAPDAYAVDSSLFTPVVIERIQQAGKPWVADSEKNRILYHKGQSYNCETFNQTIAKESFRETTISISIQMGQPQKNSDRCGAVPHGLDASEISPTTENNQAVVKSSRKTIRQCNVGLSAFGILSSDDQSSPVCSPEARSLSVPLPE